jgi:nitroreductase
MPDFSVKRAKPDHPIHDLIAARFSPYVYEPRPVEREKLLSCLEAARWAASSYNEQPWRFIVARRQEPAEFARALDCLLEANQEWARHAGVLLLTVISKTFSRNGNPNRVAEHDLGLAMGNLTLQAMSLGLHVHQMAGVNLAKVRQTYGVPEGLEPVTAAAIGYAGAAASAAAPALGERDAAPRGRKPLAEFVFAGTWGHAAKL